jgi:hypothetical protein
MGRQKNSPVFDQITKDRHRESDRETYHERMRVLRMDPVAHKEYLSAKAAYMKDYRARKKRAKGNQAGT